MTLNDFERKCVYRWSPFGQISILRNKHKISRKRLISHFQFPISFSHTPFPFNISIPSSPFLILISLFSIPHPPFLILHFSFSFLYSPFLILISSFSIPHSSFSIPHSPWRIVNDSFCSAYLAIHALIVSDNRIYLYVGSYLLFASYARNLKKKKNDNCLNYLCHLYHN